MTGRRRTNAVCPLAGSRSAAHPASTYSQKSCGGSPTPSRCATRRASRPYLQVDGVAVGVPDGRRELRPGRGVVRGGEVCPEQGEVIVGDAFGPDRLERPAVVVGGAELLVVVVIGYPVALRRLTDRR